MGLGIVRADIKTNLHVKRMIHGSCYKQFCVETFNFGKLESQCITKPDCDHQSEYEYNVGTLRSLNLLSSVIFYCDGDRTTPRTARQTETKRTARSRAQSCRLRPGSTGRGYTNVMSQ